MLKKNDLGRMLKQAKINLLVEPIEITDLIKTIVAQEEYQYLADLPMVLKKFPQFIPYYVDVMLKKGDLIKESDRKNIQDQFAEWFDDEMPEYIQVYLVRLFASDTFQNK